LLVVLVHALTHQNQFKQYMTAAHAAAAAAGAASEQQQQQSPVVQTRPSYIYGPEFVLRAIVAVTPTMQAAVDEQTGKLAHTAGKQ
jgi:xanthine/uracil permease